MSRLTIKTGDDLTDEQRSVWDYLLQSRGSAATLVGAHGGLVGPFNAMVHAPVVGGAIAATGHAVRFETSLDKRLQEVAIITVGAYWRSEFEFWAHSRMALETGVSKAVVEAIATGQAPAFERDDEAVVHAFTSALLQTGRTDEQLYSAAVELLGETGVVELLTTIGHYCTISLTLNAFAVELPEGATPRWPEAD